MFKFKLAISH